MSPYTYMSGFKQILIVVALLLAMLPCMHAHGLHLHDHDVAPIAEISATPCCDCHSCDEQSCAEDLEMPQHLTIGSVAVIPHVVAMPLFIFQEPRPLIRRMPPQNSSALAVLETIQLLI